MPGPIITLTTDFGVQDHYAGAMMGVILITYIPAAGLSADARIRIAGHHIEGTSQSYSERPGKPLAISGSQGTLEVAVGNRNAAVALGAKLGDIALVTARCGTGAHS